MRPVFNDNSRRGVSRKTLLAGILILLTLISLGILIAMPPLIMGPIINQHVQFQTVYHAKDFGLDATELTLRTADAYDISAFEVDTSDPKAVIIFMSGIHNPSVTAFFGHARMLKEHGYSSILYDMRAHGESEGDVISLGHLETLDTQAVVDYIRAKDEYSDLPIIVYGVSMGGAVAINSIGQIPEISGVISISAYSSWEDVFIENMVSLGAPNVLATIEKPFVKLYTLCKFGLSTSRVYPKKQIANLGDRPALIMHSTEDSQVRYANFERIMDEAPSHVETWTRPGDYHFMTTDLLQPENDLEYAQRVLEFLERNFGL